MRRAHTLLLACALAIPNGALQAQDHQHTLPDSTAASDTTQPAMQMQMMGMMGHMMSAMAEMHEMMCMQMMSSSADAMPSDSLGATPMGMMGQMMNDMARMMTMMSQGAGMHGHGMPAPEGLPTPGAQPHPD